MKYKLICMSFDGDYVTERPEFETLEAAWEYNDDMGSKWFFYPFRFVVTESGKTIVDAPFPLDDLDGRRVATVRKLFAAHSKDPDMLNADWERFAFTLPVPSW